jgi:transposase-like protein
MKKPSIRVSRRVREQILAELLQESSNIQSLATKHNLSIKTISRWKADYKRQKQKYLQQQNNQFIELTSLPVINKALGLKKVELIFEDYSCSIIGKINSNQLLKLVQLLEGGLC